MLAYTRTILLLFAVFILSSCTPNSTPGLIGSETASIEATIPPSSTASPSPVPPTQTATPFSTTPTNTPLPTAATDTPIPSSLNAAGPYVLFSGKGGIWISNPDGSFRTQLSSYEIINSLDLHANLSPDGKSLAFVTGNDQGLDLVILRIPGGESEIVAHLINRPPPEAYDPTSPNSFATYAISDFKNVAWQPGDGYLLAFIGAINGPTADLYIYDTQTMEITQLTDGPSQAIMPEWSPDGQFILQYGVSWVPPFGGAITGPNQVDGFWAVRVSDGEVITLPKPQGTDLNFVGWQDASHYITYDSGECYSENLRSMDILSGDQKPVMENSFWYNISQSPENGALLFSSKDECDSSLGEGVFLLLSGQETATQVLDKRAWQIDWLPESNVWQAYPEALISTDGLKQYEPPVYDSSFHPAVSKQGYQAWVVYENQIGYVMVKIPGEDWMTIYEGSISQLIWDPLEGDALLIANDDGSLYAASYPYFAPVKMGDMGGDIYQAIWTP